MTESFSINPNLAPKAMADIQSQIDQLQDRLNDVCSRALVKDIPVVQIVLSNFNPSPDEYKMLAKVFDRLAILVSQLNDLNQKKSVLQGLSEQSSWIYENVGDTERDIDTALENIFSASTNESHS